MKIGTISVNLLSRNFMPENSFLPVNLPFKIYDLTSRLKDSVDEKVRPSFVHFCCKDELLRKFLEGEYYTQ